MNYKCFLRIYLVNLKTLLLWIWRPEAYFLLQSLKQVAHGIFLSPSSLWEKGNYRFYSWGKPERSSCPAILPVSEALSQHSPHRAGNVQREVGRSGNWGQRQRVSVIPFKLPAICYQFGNSRSSGTYRTLILVIIVISNQRHGLNQDFSTLARYHLETEIAFDGGSGEGVLCVS